MPIIYNVALLISHRGIILSSSLIQAMDVEVQIKKKHGILEFIDFATNTLFSSVRCF